jgi:hypothetical protein
MAATTAPDTRRRARIVCYPWHVLLSVGATVSGNVLADQYGPDLALEPRAKIQAFIQDQVIAASQHMGVPAPRRDAWTPTMYPPFVVSPDLLRAPNASDWYAVSPATRICRVCWAYEATTDAPLMRCAVCAAVGQ